MTDSEKVTLVGAMISDFWECTQVNEDSVVSLLNAITVVIHFEGKEEENAED